MKSIIEVQNVSKQYRLGRVGTGSLSHDINRWWHRVRGKEDPYLKIGETNDRSQKGSSEYVWALRDISFSVQPGEVLGIIGRNGAGKSTLLKILSRITTPTTGNIAMRGRVASLLEIGTGMHPELTGRENIFLNGAILGMRKKEIQNKFDEIVDFSGVERYIDTPVKRYSSGMHVRLGFAVAAHLEPDILIVDEVLAVGDAEFQKKCIGKMQDVSLKEGRTVLFVSHNMEALARLCQTALYLKNGGVIDYGSCHPIVEKYLASELALPAQVSFNESNAPGNEFCRLYSAQIIDRTGQQKNLFFINEEVGIRMLVGVKTATNNLLMGFNLHNYADIHLLSSHAGKQHGLYYPSGMYETTLWIPANFLAEGMHKCSIAAMSYQPFEVHFHATELLGFSIAEKMDGTTVRGAYSGHFPGVVRPALQWESLRLTN